MEMTATTVVPAGASLDVTSDPKPVRGRTRPAQYTRGKLALPSANKPWDAQVFYGTMADRPGRSRRQELGHPPSIIHRQLPGGSSV